jgi:CRISPR-associated protein Cmr6
MKARRSELEKASFDDKSGTHPGLWMDKFLEDQTEDGDGSAGVGSKSKLLEEVARTAVPLGYSKAFVARKAALMVNRPRVVVANAKTLGRLVIGLGAKGPTEVGLHLEHTWGVPVLPGSALKGLAASAAHILVGKPGWTKAPEEGRKDQNSDFDQLFGTTDEQGEVIFHDAWWVPDPDVEHVPIHLDVMTVHHADYYGGKRDLPSDTDSPIPISFISTNGTFLVILEGEPEWTDAAFLLLEAGLRDLGIGAKTNAGYGRMSLERELSPDERRQAQENARRAREVAERNAKFQMLRETLVESFLGAQNANDVFKKFASAVRDGCPSEILADLGKRLFEKDSQCWKGWSKKANRTPEERATYGKFFRKT